MFVFVHHLEKIFLKVISTISFLCASVLIVRVVVWTGVVCYSLILRMIFRTISLSLSLSSLV